MVNVTLNDRYYEGILQLRRPNHTITAFIKSQLRRAGVRVTKEVSAPEGVDLYVTSRKFLRTLAQRLKDQFGGEVSLSPRLVTQERTTQKGVYRVALLYRASAVKKGDVVLFKSHAIKVKNVSRFVTGVDIVTSKPVSFPYSPKIAALPVHETRVIKVHPHVEVLHPETYQPLVVNANQKIILGEKVKVVFIDHACYLV